MPIHVIPEWFSNLEDEDVNFIRNFLLSSGSLKEIAELYNVSYPTVRLRLDKLIQRIKLSDDPPADNFILLIKQLVVNEKIELDVAKVLISEYKKTNKEAE